MTVAWIRRDDAPCSLRYAARGGPPTQEDEIRPLRRVGNGSECFYALTLTDLEADTEYEYGVRCPGGERSAAFRTFPRSPDPLTFVYYGDNKAGVGMHERIASRFDRHRPAFILHSGDMTSHGLYEEYRPYFFYPLRNVIDHIPLFPGRGNHEGDGRGYREVFALPRGDTWYAFHCGSAHFLVLDSTGWRHAWEEEDIGRMYAWCENELRQSDAVWRIAMHHEPSYDLGWRKDDWGHKDFLPLMRRYGVDVTLTGHAHGYQRLRPMMMRGENERRPITHVISAGAGASLGSKPLDESPFLAADARRHNYTVFTIEGERLRAEVFSEEDERLDEFELIKRGGEYDPSVLEKALWEEDYGREDKSPSATRSSA
jgi:hypothetical protein